VHVLTLSCIHFNINAPAIVTRSGLFRSPDRSAHIISCVGLLIMVGTTSQNESLQKSIKVITQ
jgi:hypothetical protein